MERLSNVISRVFDPFVMLAALFGILFYRTPIFIPAFLLMVLLPFLLCILAWKTKFISNWDISNRRQRPKILWTVLAIEVASSIFLKTTITIPILLVFFGFTVITHVWKMSGHAMASALTTGIIISKFGWSWWPVLLIVPLVGWARIATKNHTITQVIAGALYSWGLVVLL